MIPSPEEESSLVPAENHRRRVGRLLAALAMTLLGYAWPVPYVGYGFSLVWFVPAAILEVLATGPRSGRRSSFSQRFMEVDGAASRKRLLGACYRMPVRR